MDRQVTQTGALIPNATLLGGEKAKVIGLGYALQSVLGTATAVDGLAISPTSPASLSVVIGPGSIMTYAAIDPTTAFGDLGVDATHFTMKQGVLQEPGVPLAITPPGAAGYSQVFLVQAAYQDQDSFTVLPYYNAANPQMPFNGPNNSGNKDLTLRASKCVVALKPGTAAATGTQTAPSPDPGYVGLYLITVPNGASQITTANIAVYQASPVIPVKLPAIPAAVQSGVWQTGTVTGTNTLTAALNPAPSSIGVGFEFVFIAPATNTGAVTMTIPNVGTYPVVQGPSTALTGGEIVKNKITRVTFDGTNFQLGGSSSFTSITSIAQALQANVKTTTFTNATQTALANNAFTPLIFGDASTADWTNNGAGGFTAGPNAGGLYLLGVQGSILTNVTGSGSNDCGMQVNVRGAGVGAGKTPYYATSSGVWQESSVATSRPILINPGDVVLFTGSVSAQNFGNANAVGHSAYLVKLF